jgi:hypothetical protein
MKDQLASMLYFFGYVNSPDPEETNLTAFFEFDHHMQFNIDEYYQFRKVDEQMKQKVREGKVYHYKINDPSTGFDIVPPQMVANIQDPSKNEAKKAMGIVTFEAKLDPHNITATSFGKVVPTETLMMKDQ